MVQNLTRQIVIRTTPGRRLVYARCAAREGVRLSAWLRAAAERAAERATMDSAVSARPNRDGAER